MYFSLRFVVIERKFSFFDTSTFIGKRARTLESSKTSNKSRGIKKRNFLSMSTNLEEKYILNEDDKGDVDSAVQYVSLR